MRLPWSKKRRKSQHKAIDLKELSRRIVAKKMRQDENFGEEISLRVLGYHSEPEVYDEEGGGRSDFKSFMRDFKEMRKFMGELKEGGGGKSTIVKDILDSQTAQVFARSLTDTMKAMQQGQMPPGMQVQEQQTQLQEQPQLKLQPEQNILSLNDIRGVMEMEPPDAVNVLAEINPDWLKVLAASSVEGVLAQFEAFLPQNPDLEPIHHHLATSEGKKWLEICISEAKKRLEPEKKEDKPD